MKAIKILLSLMLSVAMSVFIGGMVAMVMGWDPKMTMGGIFALSAIATAATPAGVAAGEVVFKSAYVDELLKALTTIKNDFLSRIPDVSHLLEANTINYTKIGPKPNVLIDNTTYPIAAAQRTDDGKVANLRKLTTEATIITRDEIHNLPYDKTNSVIQQHKESLLEEYYKLALYSFAPDADASKMPVLVTTGDDDGTGRLRLTKTDLVKFRRALTNVGVGECDLVLCSEHVEDILLWSQVFENQYHNISKGTVLPLYGFNITQDQGYAPLYTAAGNKRAYGSTPNATDVKGSVAYVPRRLFRAYGDIEMFFTPANARYHQD